MRTITRKHQPMDLAQIAQSAPSVFATAPYQAVSDKYKFIPTSTILNEMINNGFIPVMAAESKTRLEGKKGFTKHIMRFRHSDYTKDLAVGDEIPELVLTNSHDRTSGYVLEAGIFRMVCSNGLIVASQSFERISVRHMGRTNLVNEVIEGSFKIIENLPVVMSQIDAWKAINLDADQRINYAKQALELSGSTLEVQPGQLLVPRRHADTKTDLYTTMNTVQENLLRGGIQGVSENGRFRRTRAITAISADTKLNRDLWMLTETIQKSLVA